MAGITSTKKIKGQPHLLAYITPNEVEKLKALGGQETMTKEGIPAYPESEYYGVSQSDFNKGDFTSEMYAFSSDHFGFLYNTLVSIAPFKNLGKPTS